MAQEREGTVVEILVADDDSMIRELTREILRTYGCRVETASSGRKAVEAHLRKGYDLIFMDCQMPELNGYEATGLIRRIEQGRAGRGAADRVPIVAMTGSGLEEDRQRCLEAGMDDVLCKPAAGDGFRTVLERWIPDWKAVKVDSSLASPAAAAQPDPDVAATGATPAVDPEALAAIASLNPQAAEANLRKIVSLYMDNSQKLAGEIRTAIEQADVDGLRIAAHTLKSSSAGVGARVFSLQCKELELIARSGSLEAAPALLAPLENEYRRVREALQAYL